MVVRWVHELMLFLSFISFFLLLVLSYLSQRRHCPFILSLYFNFDYGLSIYTTFSTYEEPIIMLIRGKQCSQFLVLNTFHSDSSGTAPAIYLDTMQSICGQNDASGRANAIMIYFCYQFNTQSTCYVKKKYMKELLP